MKEIEFIRHYIANAPQIMWLLGAGTSRTAGLPTATDIVWDLKIKYYCLQENQEIKQHDINNEVIRRKVQRYLDGKNFPPLWSNDEYSFYFNLTFGNDYSAQQLYLSEQLGTHKLSLNIGHKVLAGLITLQKAKLIFTTNFDEVIEQAYSKVSGNSLPTFHLEGSYAALDALNGERFPIYAKMHGDFKYQSLKNLSDDLKENDQKIQDCMLAASGRYGLVISGYSGRDQNVMTMLYKALELNNAFPKGLFWTTPNINSIAPSVHDFIRTAQAKGINAHIVETGTFDTMLSKIWRQLPNKPTEIIDTVTTSNASRTSIPMLQQGTQFPILRTNAIPIVEVPQNCAKIELKSDLSYGEIKERLMVNHPRAIITKTESVLGWGDEKEFYKGLGDDQIAAIEDYKIENPIRLIAERTFYKAFYERALITAICDDKPLLLRNDHSFYLVVDPTKSNDPIFQSLKEALKDYSGNLRTITGSVPNSNQTRWSEAVELALEEKNDMLWLIVNPAIWIEPKIERRNSIEFIKRRKLKRYNSATNLILNAWIEILFNIPRSRFGEIVETSCFKDSRYPVKFKLNTRTAFSKR